MSHLLTHKQSKEKKMTGLVSTSGGGSRPAWGCQNTSLIENSLNTTIEMNAHTKEQVLLRNTPVT